MTKIIAFFLLFGIFGWAQSHQVCACPDLKTGSKTYEDVLQKLDKGIKADTKMFRMQINNSLAEIFLTKLNTNRFQQAVSNNKPKIKFSLNKTGVIESQENGIEDQCIYQVFLGDKKEDLGLLEVNMVRRSYQDMLPYFFEDPRMPWVY